MIRPRNPTARISTRPGGGARSIQRNRIRHRRSRALRALPDRYALRWASLARARSGTPGRVPLSLHFRLSRGYTEIGERISGRKPTFLLDVNQQGLEPGLGRYLAVIRAPVLW